MIDLHTHILPAMDDGPKTAKEAAAIIKKLKAQGVKKIVATPHFLPHREKVDAFIKRRADALENLQKELSSMSDAPEILLGSEVLFHDTIFMLADLRPLCIEGTNKLLLEFSPDVTLSRRMTQHLIRFSAEKGVIPILAHIERYPKLLSQKKELEQLAAEHDCLLQISGGALLSFLSRHKIKSLLKNEMVHAIGSDTHNLTNRAPEWTDSIEKLQKICDPTYFKTLINAQKIWQ